jgi:TonB family protein
MRLRISAAFLIVSAFALSNFPALPAQPDTECTAVSAPFPYADSERKIRDDFLKDVCEGPNADIYYLGDPALKDRIERVPGPHPIRGNIYSDAAKRKGLEGNLLVAVVVEEDGSIKHTAVIESTGHKLLDDGAVDWLKKQSFTQYTLDGKPIRIMFYFPMKFKLAH